MSVSLFERDYHTKSPAQQNISGERPSATRSGIGRAPVRYISWQGHPLVLKHYYRGGMVARINRDLYLARSAEQTRAFREFQLLKTLHEAGLPVPTPVAAHARRVTVLPFVSLYRCDLATEEISDVITLSDYIAEQSLDPAGWQLIGKSIRAFHDLDVYHADLNARNILLRKNNCDDWEVYLIDFDNSSIRSSSPTWKNANLARLLRSLNKFKRNTDPFYFGKDDWGLLLEGYNEV